MGGRPEWQDRVEKLSQWSSAEVERVCMERRGSYILGYTKDDDVHGRMGKNKAEL